MTKNIAAILAGPISGWLVYLLVMNSQADAAVGKMAFITIWMAVWWITEAVELGVTSLLPFVLLPLFHLIKAEEVALQYMEQTIFLFIGGFFLAYAMEKWNLHHRIAYRIILITGSSPMRILAGIMITTYLISMWISNTATTLMLLGAVLAIVKHEELFDKQSHKNISAAYLIALSYSATIGGMATIVGTPTNMIFAGYLQDQFPEKQISFMQWSAVGIPFSALLLTAGFFILKFLFKIHNKDITADKEFIRNKYRALGKITSEQKIISAVFICTALLWMTRTGINAGPIQFAGWEQYFGKGFLKDSTVAIAMSVLLFIIPASGKKGFLLQWEDVKKLPFSIILLFGGGFSLAKGIDVSGLGDYLALQLQIFKDFPVLIIILALVILVTFLSELASNVATITLMLPILAALAKAINIDPLLLMLPATFAASFGFMLHIATAPNTIVYATGYVPAKKLMKAGLAMNVVAIILILMVMYFY
jgi:solute carrier family 13 (sodium-dependent dicarboxylate transporter), member 2/3/5